MDIDLHNPEIARALVERFAQELSEHFDAVQIMVTWNIDANTHVVFGGNGNWYARTGMAHDFLDHDSAQTTAKEIAGEMSVYDENDYGDGDWGGGVMPQ